MTSLCRTAGCLDQRAKKLVLGACIKLALIRPAWYVHESWLSYDQLGVQNSWSSWPTRCVHKVGCYKTAGRLDQLGACKKVGPGPTRCVHKVGSYQTSLVRARESWLSYDQLGTCKTAGPLGQLGACIKLAVIRPARYVRESWLWPAWYVQNSWSSWPTRYVQKSWSRANSVRA